MARVSQIPQHLTQTNGCIEVICGPMFSGKTEELIRRLRRAQIAQQRVHVFKPAIDIRYAKNEIVSHSSLQLPSTPVENVEILQQSLAAMRHGVDVIGIDEVQFFEESIVELCGYYADSGVRVVVAGLDLDYLAQPFGPMPQLLALAESVTKVLAVCMVCGAPAARSQRVHADLTLQTHEQEQVLVGAADKYEARCRHCYVSGVDAPSTFSRQSHQGGQS